jgi:hypothetical protein
LSTGTAYVRGVLARFVDVNRTGANFFNKLRPSR